MPSQIAKKLHTLASNPKGVFKKYIINGAKSLAYPFSGMLRPYLDEDYEVHWNYTSFSKKTVLDLGADYGSTAAWLHKKGASKVIAIEADKKLYQRLQSYSKNKEWLTPINDFIDSPQKIDQLIVRYKPDIAKVDIEGAEKYLINCTKLSDVPVWIIEVHSDELGQLLTDHFQKSHFEVKSVAELNCGVLFTQKMVVPL